jgi:hypothetical protein
MTATGMAVMFLISAMIRPRSLLRVGSPEPEKVMMSIVAFESRASLRSRNMSLIEK